MNIDLLPEEDILITHRSGEPGFYMRPEQQKANPHFHYQYELLLCAGGTAEFVVSDCCYTLTPGSVLFINNLENHFIISHDDDYERYAIRFSTQAAELMRNPLLLSLFRQRPKGFCHLYQCGEKELQRYQRLFHTMEREYALQKPCWSQVICSTLLILLSCIYRRNSEMFPASRHPEGQMLIFRVQSYLESHLNEELSLDAVSARFFVDKYHLSHQFTRFTGYSFKQYITSARLSKAKDLLLHSDGEIREIATQVGYHSATHFIRVFKEAEGLSPLQYRLRQREG